MSRLLTESMTLLFGPLAVGVIILALYFWLIKPLLFVAGAVVISFMIAFALSRAVGE